MSDKPFLPKVFFFAGSSSVGKTTTLQALDQDTYKTVVLSARVARAALGNPDWQDMIDDVAVATLVQRAVFKNFVEQISGHLAEFVNDFNAGTLTKHLVFDRSLWDVPGYSSAFKVAPTMITDQIAFIRAFEQSIVRESNIVCRIAHFAINPDLPYQLIAARPPETIRDLTARAISGYLKIPLSIIPIIQRDHATKPLDEFVAELQ